MRQVTLSQLSAVIEALPGAQPMSAKTRTVLDLKKTGNPFGQIVKFSHFQGFIGVNYGNAVNRQQVREGAEHGTFEAQAPKWGVRVGKKHLLHNDRLYCPIKIGNVITQPTYLEASTGVNLTHDQFAAWDKEKSSSADAQGVEKEIVWRTYKCESFLELTVGGETYVVVPEVVDAAVPAFHAEAPAEQVEAPVQV